MTLRQQVPMPGATEKTDKSKVCPTCGRTFTWRKRWARTWHEVVYCSERCRGGRGARAAQGAELEARILALLKLRARGKTICPSEILPDEDKQDAQRMEEVRAAARRLAHRAIIDIVQRGVIVDPDGARGPIRLRLR